MNYVKKALENEALHTLSSYLNNYLEKNIRLDIKIAIQLLPSTMDVLAKNIEQHN